jgi:diguanylate cyclase (GGDEF)-like protein
MTGGAPPPDAETARVAAVLAARPAGNGWRLGTRIVALSLGLLLLVQAASYLALRASLDANARKAIAADLVVGERALQRLLDQNSTRLADGARVLATDFGFRAAVNSADEETIVSALENHGGRIGASVAALLDTRFALRASTLDDPVALDTVVARLMAMTGHREQSSVIELVRGRPTQFVLVPMRAPLTVGWVLMGFTLDKTLAVDLRNISGLHLMVLSRDTPQAPWAAGAISTLAPDVDDALRRDLGQAVPQPTLHAGGEEYSALVLPLNRGAGGAGGAGGESVAVLMRSVDEALAPYVRLKWTMLGLTLLGVAAFGVGSVFTARRVTVPIRRLAAAAQRLGQGDYETPMGGTQRHDEIGELAQRFEQMRVSIADKQQEVLKAAYWDRLTGLPNRVQFREAVSATIVQRMAATGAGDRAPLAVLMLDLDRFKQINEALGYRFGDMVLQRVGERLVQHMVRDGDLVARLGSDEFAVLLSRADAATAAAIAQRLDTALDTSLALAAHTVDLSVGIGIACWPQHASDVDSLLSRAEMAMYAAKRRTQGPQMYEPGIDSGSAQNLTLMSELRQAVEHGQLRMYLQPKVALADGHLVGAEALVRWQHPQRGLVPPGLFIPFAEQTGFVRQLTHWIFGEAARQWPLLRAAGIELRISINLSARDLLDAELIERLDLTLLQNGVPASAFCLEVTESAIMDDPERAKDTLHQLSARGFKLSIDDFGTGHSSFAYLKNLPVHELKVDQSFVMGMEKDEKDAKIVGSIIDVAHNLDLSVVAEGIENQAVWNRLRALGCDEGQGYYMGRPVPVEAFKAWYLSWNDHTEAKGRASLMAQVV